jgi:phage shock protein E
MQMKFKPWMFMIIGAVTGALGGYLYYHYIGCMSGSCAITSNPFISTIYGSVMGGLFFNMLVNDKTKKYNKNEYRNND